MIVSECTNRPILSQCGLKDFNYQVDTYIGCEHYCYYCYVLPQAETDWSKQILIYKDIINQLSQELDKIPPQTIYIGYHSDPYQPCEAEYKQTRKVLKLFLKKGFSASILTKSDLITRDIDLLKEMSSAAVSVSFAFNDDQTRRLFEANTVDTERRIEALHQLKEAGIRTGAMLCPVIPYITDPIKLIDKLQQHASVIWIYGISFSDSSDKSWQYTQGILKNEFPDLIGQIETAVYSKDHEYWVHLKENLKTLKNDRKLNLKIHL